jgi:hypothetical protein
MYKITITTKATGPVFEPGKARQIIHANLEAAMWDAVQFLENQVKERTPGGSPGEERGLRGSIFGEVRGRGLGELLGIVSSPFEYAEPVELGSRPHMPPVAPIVPWAKKVLGLEGKAAVSAAWGIAKTIKVRGTPARYMFRRGLEENIPKVIEIFEAAGFNIAIDLNA